MDEQRQAGPAGALRPVWIDPPSPWRGFLLRSRDEDGVAVLQFVETSDLRQDP